MIPSITESHFASVRKSAHGSAKCNQTDQQHQTENDLAKIFLIDVTESEFTDVRSGERDE